MILCEGMVFRKIKDIRVGDKVIVEGGIVKTVAKTTSGTTDMYRVSQKWGEDYVVSKNHRLYLEQYVYNGKLKTSKRKKIIMNPEDYIGLSGYKKQHTFSVKSAGLEFDDKDITIPPYLLGLWLGDGRQDRFTIIVNTEKDQEILFYLGRIAEMKNLESHH
jgi:replicative DNA helicase